MPAAGPEKEDRLSTDCLEEERPGHRNLTMIYLVTRAVRGIQTRTSPASMFPGGNLSAHQMATFIVQMGRK